MAANPENVKELKKAVESQTNATQEAPSHTAFTHPNIETTVQSLSVNQPQETQLSVISNILGQSGYVIPQNELSNIFFLEGAHFLDGNQWMIDALALHCKSACNFKTFFEAIYNAMNAVEAYRGNYQIWAKDFQEFQALTSIPAARPRHCLAVALIKDRLIYTNTGHGLSYNPNGESGTFIYKIRDIRLITPDFLDKCFQIKNKDFDQKAFMEHLQSVVDTNQTPVFIPSKMQEVGNCVISSLKKNVKGMLACLWSLATYSDLSDDHILEGLKHTLHAYKVFTDTTLRNYAIDRFNKLCHDNTDPKSVFFTTLLHSISRYFMNRYAMNFRVPPGDDKPNKDKNRAKKLFDGLPEAYKAKLPEIQSLLYPASINTLLFQCPCIELPKVQNGQDKQKNGQDKQENGHGKQGNGQHKQENGQGKPENGQGKPDLTQIVVCEFSSLDLRKKSDSSKQKSSV